MDFWNWEPAYVEAWGTAMAAVFAAVAAAFAFGAYRAEKRAEAVIKFEAESAQREQDRTQAKLVAAWVEAEDDEWFCTIRNGSQLPVFAVQVRYYNGRTQLGATTRHRVIAPNSSGVRLPISGKTVSKIQALPSGHQRSTRITTIVDFTDANGAHWRRSTDGSLDRIYRSRRKNPRPSVNPPT